MLAMNRVINVPSQTEFLQSVDYKPLIILSSIVLGSGILGAAATKHKILGGLIGASIGFGGWFLYEIKYGSLVDLNFG